MYNQMKNEFMRQIQSNFTGQQLEIISQALDTASAPYTITAEKFVPTVIIGRNVELLQSYITCQKISGMSDGYIRNTWYLTRDLFNEVNKPVEKITANDLRVWLYKYKERTGIADVSLDKYRQFVGTFFKWLHTEGYIKEDISGKVKPIKYEKNLRTPLTQVQLEHVRRACKTPYERMVIEMLYSTGCRASELAGLSLNDIDTHDGTVHLFGKGKKHRESYINAKALVALDDYFPLLRESDEWLIPSRKDRTNHIHYASIENCCRKLSARSGIPFTPHVIRHTMATDALRAGMKIEVLSAILGHEDISTTMIYAEISREHIKAEHRRCVV